MGLLLLFIQLLATSAFSAAEPPVLRVAWLSEPMTLDWHRASSPVERFMASFLMRGLLRYDEQRALVCDLCQRFTVSADGAQARFELPPETRWSDGRGLKPADFAETFRAHPHFRVLAEKPGAPNELALQLLPGAVLAELSLPRAFPKGAESATLGPYTLAAWEKGKRIVFEGNPEFKGKRPVYRVDFLFGTRAEGFARFRAGKADLWANPTTDELLKLGDRKRVEVSPTLATRFLVLNPERGPFKEPTLRAALLYALDRHRLPSELKQGERPAAGLIPPGLEGSRELPVATQDLERAKLEASRYVEVHGTKPVTVLVSRGSEEIDSSLEAWLRARAKVLAVPFGFKRTVAAGVHDFDLKVIHWQFSAADATELLSGLRALLPETKALRAPGDALLELEKSGIVIPLTHPSQAFLLGQRVLHFAATPYGFPDLVKIQLKQ